MKLPFIKRGMPADTSVQRTGEAPVRGIRGIFQKVKGAMKGKKGKRIVAVILLLAIAGGGVGVYFQFFAKKDSGSDGYTEETAQRRDIEKTLTATGTLQPLNQYNVTASVKGEVLKCNFNEGDAVTKGEVLYEVDSSDVEDDIKKGQISVEQSRLSYEQQLTNMADLTVTSSKTGVVTSVSVDKGDSVNSGDTIATVRDSSTMTISLPFNKSSAKKFYIGEAAKVSMDNSYETLTGHITEIDGTDSVLTGNQLVRYVKIAVKNPGALSTSSSGAATIAGVASNSSAKFAYNEDESVKAEASGKVTWVVSKGQKISSGSSVARLASTDLQNSLQNAQLGVESSEIGLQSTVDSLKDYQITAPISGKVVTKNTKVGDKLDNTNGNTTLAVIYDLSKLTFDIALDELDVNEVSVGQTVNITVDALDGKQFTGKITKVSIAGTTENNATTYPVTVQIDNPPSNLYPGMNVNASIVVSQVKNAVAVPVAAVQRGNTVYVKGEGTQQTQTGTTNTSSSTAGTQQTQTGTTGTQQTQTGTTGTSSTTGTQQTAAAGTGQTNTGTKSKTGTKSSGSSGSDVPTGFHAVTVQTGISDDDYIEIKSGISAGDVVYVPQVKKSSSSSSSQNNNQMMGGGGPGGGGMP